MTQPLASFETTRWTLVWQAAARDEPRGRPALEQLLERYWMPLYAYARQRGMRAEDAEDATQEFLSRVAGGDLLLNADPARGKFRTYLLTAWRNFLVDLYRQQQTVRRGGQAGLERLDWASGESLWQRQRLQPASAADSQPDEAFMIAWAQGLVENCQLQLKSEYEHRGRSAFFDALMPFVTQHVDARGYAQAAERLQVSPSAVKVALHRLRQRFAAKLRQLVAETLDDPSEVEAELGELLTLLSR